MQGLHFGAPGLHLERPPRVSIYDCGAAHRFRVHPCFWLRLRLSFACTRLGGEVVSEFAAAGVGATHMLERVLIG